MSMYVLCESSVNITNLAKAGLSMEEVVNLGEYVKAGKFKDLLNIAGIAMHLKCATDNTMDSFSD